MPQPIREATVAAAHQFLDVTKHDLTLLDEPATEVADGVVALHAPGHTPGHLLVSVAGGGDRFTWLTDLVHHHAIMLPHPQWHVALDTDLDAAANMRQDWLKRFVVARTLVGGSHLPFPALGHVRQVVGGVAWVPVEWQW
jgi:glyoxylase-like metal-dependent hydrolase (beta-lactamase superfamily II)